MVIIWVLTLIVHGEIDNLFEEILNIEWDGLLSL